MSSAAGQFASLAMRAKLRVERKFSAASRTKRIASHLIPTDAARAGNDENLSAVRAAIRTRWEARPARNRNGLRRPRQFSAKPPAARVDEWARAPSSTNVFDFNISGQRQLASPPPRLILVTF